MSRALVRGLAAVAALAAAGCGAGERATVERGDAAGAHPAGTAKHVPAVASSTAEPAQAGGPVVTLRPGRPAQRFTGWGAGVVTETQIDPLASPDGMTPAEVRRMDELIFRSAGVRLLRIWSPGAGFGARDGRLRADDGRFALMRRAARRGVRFMLTGGDAAPGLKSGGTLKAGAEDAYAAGLVEVLELARRSAGVQFSWVAVGNEVDGSSVLQMSPGQARLVYESLARRIRAKALSTRIVLGDNTSFPASLTYVGEERRANGLGRPAAVASHAYGGTDDDRRSFRALARELGAPVWMTEWTRACPQGDCPDDPSIGFALARAQAIVRDLTVAGASTWFLFRPVSDSSHGADEGIVNRYLDRPSGRRLLRGKRLAVFRQFTWAGRPGSRVRPVPGGDGVTALAFTRGRRTALVAVNDRDSARVVSVDLGSRGGTLRRRDTSAKASFAARPRSRYEGRPIRATLPPYGVVTWVVGR